MWLWLLVVRLGFRLWFLVIRLGLRLRLWLLVVRLGLRCLITGTRYFWESFDETEGVVPHKGNDEGDYIPNPREKVVPEKVCKG